MIGADVSEAVVVFRGDVPRGSAAYVDREWLPVGGSGAVPALVVASHDPDATAAAALLTVAQDAAAAAKPGSVDVVGAGMLAQLVRLVTDGASERPHAIVDTTGDPAAIASALERVADLGTVVLAGESLGRRADLDLYCSVHVRGLTLVGIAGPVAAGAPATDTAMLAECRRALVPARFGEPAPSGGAWYRISRAETAEP